jgi:large subunit ribosomal protein L21
MFAIVRTGGKQYRVAAGDKIVIEKIAGEAGDTIALDDVLLAGEGGDLKSTDGLIVSAEIIAQAKADKVTVFKKKRRHNYRRKRGHRQQLTILRILSIGGKKADTKKAAPATEKAAPAAEKPAKAAAKPKPEAPAKGGAEAAPEARAEAPKKAAATRKAPDAKPAAPKKSTKKPAAGKAE